MADYDVIVIGAGCGGLAAGALLAKQGRRVLVLEQSNLVGGCCSTFERQGYHFDVGASIVEAISTIEVVFKALGTTFHQEVELIPADPIYSCIFRDGSRLKVSTSVDETAKSIAELSPEDGANLYRYMARFAKFTDGGGEDFFTSPATNFEDMSRLLQTRPVIASFAPFFVNSYEDVIKQYFVDPRVQQAMCFQSFYAGHSPDLAPGIFAILPYLEHKGLYYPRGGMIAIPQALQSVGARFGLELRVGARVKKVIVRNQRVRAVRLADGTEITADVVVSDVHAQTLYLDLIGEEHLPWLARVGIKSYEPSLTCPMLHLGLDYTPPLDAHHTLLLAPVEEMDDTYWKRCRRGLLPERQFGLACMPTMSDPLLAPEGRHILSLILMGPYRLVGKDWDTEKEAFIDRALDELSAYAIPGLKEHVEVAELSSPLDFERRLLLPRGAIYGLQQDITAQSVFRPSAKSKSIQGLYLAGASTHPGGGVPPVIGSGMIAANLIDKYE